MEDMRRMRFQTVLPFLFLTLTARGEWELRGFFGPGGSPEVSLRETSTGKSRWVATGEFDGDIYVESADASKGMAVVSCSEGRFILKLSREGLPTSGDAPLSGEIDIAHQPQPELSDSSVLLDKLVESGMRRLEDEHPEYFDGTATRDEVRAMTAARNKVYRDAIDAVRAARDAQ